MSTTNTQTIWTETFRVRSYEMDPGGRASIATICNYLQEAAGKHAQELGVSIDQLKDRNLTWVLARLRVEMDALPAWREEVVVETWPSGVDRLFAMREFLIFDGDREVIGRGSSAWLMIDRERRRPIRMPDFITSLELADRPRPIAALPARLPDLEQDVSERAIEVRFSDLDVNGHVNNVRYVEWSVECVPPHIREEHELRTLDVHFLAEGSYGDPVVVRSAPMAAEDGTAAFGHRVLSGSRELARSRTVWKQR